MRIKSHRQRKGPLAEINVVPYIDVMLVLLVIFMITAPLLSQGIHVNLPQASARALPSKKELPLVVSINAGGQYFLNVAEKPDVPVTEQELLYRVAALLKLAEQQHAERPVYVKGDRAVDYGRVVAVMALLQKAGANDVGLITDPQ
ncbi:MAG: protein TolR [Coxiella sp. RIFCSPHIGHO2_12_FULL_42_15]|nr:MAG: protein TolR [Coxiella sp. RIFCSPHIGHO2_12_FULL_42_15]